MSREIGGSQFHAALALVQRDFKVFMVNTWMYHMVAAPGSKPAVDTLHQRLDNENGADSFSMPRNSISNYTAKYVIA